MYITFTGIINYASTYYKSYLASILIAVIAAAVTFINLDKEYEAYFEIKLGKITDKQKSINSEKIAEYIPFVLDAQRSLMNPENIDQLILTNCGIIDNNNNRKIFVKNTFVTRKYDNNVLSYRLRLKDYKKLRECGDYLSRYQIKSFSGRVDQVLEEYFLENPGLNKKLITVEYPFLFRGVTVSDSYIYPSAYKLIILFIFMLLCFNTLIIWIKKLAYEKLHG